MSLLITSSSQPGETNQIGIAVPYQFRNNIKNPLTVLKDSEIAVESVKINRIPLIDFGPAQVANFWFGERLLADQLDTSISYFIPNDAIVQGSKSPSDFSEEFKNVLQNAYSLHPEINSQAIDVTVLTGTDGQFAGFRFNIPQVGAAPSDTVPDPGTRTEEYTEISQGLLDWDGTTLEADGDEVTGQLLPIGAEGGPIGLNGGTLVYDNLDFSTGITVGLSRPVTLVKTDTGLESQDFDTLFADTSALNQGIGATDESFMDFAAELFNGELKLYHAVTDTSTGSARTVMSEIVYYNKSAGDFNIPNGDNSDFITTDAPIPSASITDITFTVTGEKLKVSCSGKTVVDVVKFNSASFKGQIPKPIGQTCWKMYPTVSLFNSGDAVDITEYKCRTSSTIFNNQPENSWVSRCTAPVVLGLNGDFVDHRDQLDAGAVTLSPWNNAMMWPSVVDTRPCYIINNADSQNASSAVVRAYKGITGGAIIEDYENIFIMGPSERYMPRAIQEWQPNTGPQLGFQSFAINPDSGMVNGAFDGASFVSAQRPDMTSAQSTFVRVPTLTHETYNFGTGNPSKILFQVPRFDNSGAETGALYYQNSDKTFIDLKNATDFKLSDLDVQMVRKDETFAKDLTGSTEVVFIIREKK